MAVPSADSEIRYAATGSAGPFAIPFPFLDAAHIYVAIAEDDEETPVLLATTGYTVTRDADGAGGSVLLDEAVASPKIVVIFRELPLTQPTVFQPAGPFPAKAAETALDRLLMQVQQLARHIEELGGGGVAPGGENSGGILTWSDATARGGLRPLYAGQLGVERETQTVWIGQSTAAGDWLEFQPRRTNRLVLGYVADVGLPGDEQDDVAARLAEWQPDAVLFAGDNNYSGIGYGGDDYDADWLAFEDWVAAGTAFPALGNHDMDSEGWEDRHIEKFGYLPQHAEGRYYKVSLGAGMVDLFVLNSGFNTVRDLVEPDGNEVDSAQHEWFVEALAASTARWRIAMFHHPPVSLNAEEGRVAPEMAWPELAQMHLILCGHVHLLELLRWKETMLANFSAVAYDNGTADSTLSGEAGFADRSVWVDAVTRGMGRIIADDERLEIEAWSIEGVLLFSRNAEDFKKPSLPTGDVLFSASDKILGRATAGAGAGEEITCTAAARAVLDDATGAAMLNTMKARGADIASAATLNLDTATGDFVDVTGTTTITAITLADGDERWVRFTGALTLTHGVNLQLPGGANITTVAGHVALFRGYASGVALCLFYGIGVTNAGRALIDDADATAQRNTLGASSGVWPVDKGGTGLATATGLLAGNGTAAMTPRTITGATNAGIAVADGSGATANPTLKLQPPAFSATGSSGSVGITGSFAVVPFDTENYDHGSAYDTSAKAFTAPVSGVYRFGINVFVSSTVAEVVRFRLFKGGSYFARLCEPVTVGGNSIVLAASNEVALTAGEVIDVRVSGDIGGSNSTMNVAASTSTGVLVRAT